jgi:putative DNA primase/helicase
MLKNLGDRQKGDPQRILEIPFALTDSGNAELIASTYGDCLRYNHRIGKWLIWRSGAWSIDVKGEVFLMAKDAARSRLVGAADISDDTIRRKRVEWAIASESKHRLEAALELAKREPPLSDAGDTWDADPFLFGVGNGVVDLRSGKLRLAVPEDLMMLRSGVLYDPSATCPRFDQFLFEVFGGNAEMVCFIQKAIGYCLTGDTSEQCIFLCYGSGANGKTTFLETVRNLLWSYAHNLPFSSFEVKARSGIPNDLAGLVSKRFVTASETSENSSLNEARVKALTGQDLATARHLYSEYFSFSPTAKHWLSFNHKPRVTDDSHGFWRRVRLIEFSTTFDGEQQDKSLNATLRAEASGILLWAVKGCLLWQTEGLGMPATIRKATELYRSESDSLAEFLEEEYEVCPDGFVESAALRRRYECWAANYGEVPLSIRAMATRMHTRGVVSTRGGNPRVRGWRGLRPKVEPFTRSQDSRTDVDNTIQ